MVSAGAGGVSALGDIGRVGDGWSGAAGDGTCEDVKDDAAPDCLGEVVGLRGDGTGLEGDTVKLAAVEDSSLIVRSSAKLRFTGEVCADRCCLRADAAIEGDWRHSAIGVRDWPCTVDVDVARGV